MWKLWRFLLSSWEKSSGSLNLLRPISGEAAQTPTKEQAASSGSLVNSGVTYNVQFRSRSDGFFCVFQPMEWVLTIEPLAWRRPTSVHPVTVSIEVVVHRGRRGVAGSPELFLSTVAHLVGRCFFSCSPLSSAWA